jgi:ribosomal protein S18 acetylase RimI-like enzyme
VEVLESNTAARRLYESIGFEFVDRINQRVVRDDEAIPALRLRLVLDG